MEVGLLSLEEGNRDSETINSLFRAAHSIKGGGATFGFEAMACLTHVLETLLEELRSGKRDVEAQAIDAILGSVDVLRALLREAEHGIPADPGRGQGRARPPAACAQRHCRSARGGSRPPTSRPSRKPGRSASPQRHRCS